MSALLYIGGVLYLLAVIRVTGKRFEAHHLAWRDRLQGAILADAIQSSEPLVKPKRKHVRTRSVIAADRVTGGRSFSHWGLVQ